MHILQTVLVFVGIPVAVVAVVTGLVFAGSAGRSRRYRPGRPFRFTPVWFLSAPAASDPAASDPAGRAVGAAAGAAPLPAGGIAGRSAGSAAETADAPAGERAAGGDEWPPRDQARLNVTGGASDSW